MEQQRILLLASLFFISYLLWVAWQDQFHPKTPPVASTPISIIEDATRSPVSENNQLPAGSASAEPAATPRLPGAVEKTVTETEHEI